MCQQLLEPGKRIGGWPNAVSQQNATAVLSIY
jgi:hypothetical protein